MGVVSAQAAEAFISSRVAEEAPPVERSRAEPDPVRRLGSRRLADPPAEHPAEDRRPAARTADRWAENPPGARRGAGPAVRPGPDGIPAQRRAADGGPASAGSGPAPRAARTGHQSRRRSSRRLLLLAVAGAMLVLVGVGVVGLKMLRGGPAHVLTTPDQLGAYVRRPQLEKQMNAGQLQQQVIAKSAGQASHVVSAVYEDSNGATKGQTPQMILFIGGNLTGVSASNFIASFTQQSHGAFVTSPGTLGGSAACVNAQASVPGSVALCTWADNNTFGVVASPTMSAAKLAVQLRTIRPMVEHVAK
jgi:hypothetical protein